MWIQWMFLHPIIGWMPRNLLMLCKCYIISIEEVYKWLIFHLLSDYPTIFRNNSCLNNAGVHCCPMLDFHVIGEQTTIILWWYHCWYIDMWIMSLITNLLPLSWAYSSFCMLSSIYCFLLCHVTSDIWLVFIEGYACLILYY